MPDTDTFASQAILHQQIMNIPCEPTHTANIERICYKQGHRDARHAAAELAQSREAALTAQVARLTAERDGLKVKHEVACGTITAMQIEREQRRSYEVLSSLSSFVGCGLGDKSTSADEYERRIREGIDTLIRVHEADLSAIDALLDSAGVPTHHEHPPELLEPRAEDDDRAIEHFSDPLPLTRAERVERLVNNCDLLAFKFDHAMNCHVDKNDEIHALRTRAETAEGLLREAEPAIRHYAKRGNWSDEQQQEADTLLTKIAAHLASEVQA